MTKGLVVCNKMTLTAIVAVAIGLNVSSLYATGTLTTIHQFMGGDGSRPTSFLQANDGNFYGTAFSGGMYSCGNVFKVTPTGAFNILYSFTGGDDGSSPSSLIQAKDGNFYGVTANDGLPGTVFKITPQGSLTTVYRFTGGDDGEAAWNLIQASSGTFYGVAVGDGSTSFGTVFSLTPQGTLTTIYTFTGGLDGFNPVCIVQGKDGNFYGTTGGGAFVGGSSYGTFFRVTAQGTLTSLYTFTGMDDGAYPFLYDIKQGSSGTFYGGTIGKIESGGPGTVFEVTPAGALSVLYSFTGGTDGSSPAGLIRSSDGNFYGTTYGRSGTLEEFGTVFKLTSQGTLTTLYSFTDGDDGSGPSVLLQGKDGNFYGITAPIYQSGSVFRFTGGGTSIDDAFTITKSQAKLNFAKPNMDSFSLAAYINLGASFNSSNKTVMVSFGDAKVFFVLDAKGKGVSAPNSCKLSYNKRTGLWMLTSKVKLGHWRAVWEAHGMTNETIVKPGQSITMPIVVAIDDEVFAADKPMLYQATEDKAGMAR
jgi:uncharacterized repeat protein (TIGR03803 family)